MTVDLENHWALILGASSGFGEAAALELSKSGMNIFGVHLDRKATIENVQRIQESIQSNGRRACFFNINAADPQKRDQAIDEIREVLAPEGASKIRIFLHSLAFGALGRLFPEDSGRAITPKQMDMTLDVMAHSLVYWIQALLGADLLGKGSRIYAMTSSGGHSVWPSYGPVSAAKAALESHIRQIALELAPRGISANAIQAGVTDTPALRKIPGHEEMLDKATRVNPGARLTTPQDVAQALVGLSHPGTHWMTGNVVRVDGGEDITG